jgi:hypothetical protein
MINISAARSILLCHLNLPIFSPVSSMVVATLRPLVGPIWRWEKENKRVEEVHTP